MGLVMGYNSRISWLFVIFLGLSTIFHPNISILRGGALPYPINLYIGISVTIIGCLGLFFKYLLNKQEKEDNEPPAN